MLDGGLKKWLRKAARRESGKVTPKPGNFKARLDPGYVRSQQQMSPISHSRAEQVIDARASDRFRGQVAEPRPGLRSGHIPGSRNLPYNELFDAATGTMKPLDDLRQAFTGAGVDLDAPIVTSCGSGVSRGGADAGAVSARRARTRRFMTARGRNGALPDGPPVATGPA